MSDKFFKSTYDLETPEDTQEHYQKWAATYEDEVAAQGYATPGRVAEALWSQQPQAQTPVLDYGCGTGLSGLALHAAGFLVIDGMDPTPNMLEVAAAKGVYRTLSSFEITDPAPLTQDAYTAITAIGVIGTGAAPPETLDLLMHALPKGGMLAFSYNDHTLADHSYTTRLNDWLDMGAARLLFREYGPHLPGMNLKSDVYVIEKT
ncbi:methyltransferase domain-containing protein [Rhodobacteraceae bacterium B1Z28]|uniref:Methyltransferase domain-containing protein n=1 Tax=Ruegeria haliotis TaxID=2747601 RepID=A0ABX2PM45_9RHOB|nr:methyltransferase domain-containing protein [Ruegeria haliotis]NVO55198.1 methyltransferase domain-containing protein [Ruegeria haliotis]